MDRMTDERMAEIEDSGALTHTEAIDLAHEAIDALKAERKAYLEHCETIYACTVLITELEATIDEVRKYAAVMFDGAHRDIAKKLIRIVKLKDLPEDERDEYV